MRLQGWRSTPGRLALGADAVSLVVALVVVGSLSADGTWGEAAVIAGPPLATALSGSLLIYGGLKYRRHVFYVAGLIVAGTGLLVGLVSFIAPLFIALSLTAALVTAGCVTGLTGSEVPAGAAERGEAGNGP
jgi:hypothetical protein